MRVIMTIETDDPSDCIFGMKTVKSFIAGNHEGPFGLVFENGIQTFIIPISNGYSVRIGQSDA